MTPQNRCEWTTRFHEPLMTSLMPTPREAPKNDRSEEVVEESVNLRTCRRGVSNAPMTFSSVIKMAATKLSLILHATMSRSVVRVEQNSTALSLLTCL
jgi:hypothetical protein